MGVFVVLDMMVDVGEQVGIGMWCVLCFLQCGEQMLGVYWFEQVVDGIEVESLDGVIVIGCGENNGWWMFESVQMISQFDVIYGWYLDIGEYDIDCLFVQKGQCCQVVGCFVDDFGW